MTPVERRLQRAHARAVKRVSTESARIMRGGWDRLRTIDVSAQQQLRAIVLPDLFEVLVYAATLTDAYLEALLEVPPVRDAEIVEPDWVGPFVKSFRELERTGSVDSAVAAGAARSETAGHMAAVSTARVAADRFSSPRLGGWRRMPNGDSCQWCVSAASETYGTATAADIGHDGCDCSVAPILR